MNFHFHFRDRRDQPIRSNVFNILDKKSYYPDKSTVQGSNGSLVFAVSRFFWEYDFPAASDGIRR